MQLLRGCLKNEANAGIVFLITKTDHDAVLVRYGTDGALELSNHPLTWREVSSHYSGGSCDFHFDKAFKPVLHSNGQSYSSADSARQLIQSGLKRKAEFRYGALSVLVDALPSGDIHLFIAEGGFIGRFATVDDARMVATAINAPAILFHSVASLQKLLAINLTQVLRALDPSRKWPAKPTPKQYKEIFSMAKTATKKAPTKIVKAEARQRRADGPVNKAWAIFERMKDKPSKDIVAACVAAGVNKGTASTQLGRWRKKMGIVMKRGGDRKKKKEEAKPKAAKTAKVAAKKVAAKKVVKHKPKVVGNSKPATPTTTETGPTVADTGPTTAAHDDVPF